MGNRTKIFNKDFVLLCLITLVTSLTSQSVNTVLSLYAQSLGANLSLAGTVVGISSVACLIMMPFTGPMTNRLNRRMLVKVSLIVACLGNVGFALASSVSVLLVCRFIIGLSQGVSTTAMMVMVVDTLPTDRVTIGVGYYGLASTVVQSVGPALALAISDRFGFPMLFFSIAALCVVNFLGAFLLPDAKPAISEPFSLSSIKLREIVAPESIVPAVIGFLFAFNNGVQLAFVAPYAADTGIGGAGMYFTIQSLLMVFARVFLGKMTNSRKVTFTAYFAGTFLLMFALFMGFGHSQATLYLAGACFGLAYGTLLPVTQTLSMQLVPPERRGSGSSTYFIGIYTALSLGGTVGGAVAEHFGYKTMFLSLLVPTLCAMALATAKANFPVNQEAYAARREKQLQK